VYTVSLSKSRLSPAQQLILLGFGIDTVLQQYFVPEEKLRRILAVLADILHRLRTARVAVAELQSVVGKLQALLLAVPCVGTFLVAAHRALSAADRAVVLPSEVLHDFRDLLLLRRWTRLSKWRLELHTALRMETDASGHGWGAILYAGGTPLTAAGLFNQDEAALNILVKEALAVTKAITNPGLHGPPGQHSVGPVHRQRDRAVHPAEGQHQLRDHAQDRAGAAQVAAR